MPHLDDIDIADPFFYQRSDPHPVFRRLREEKPIFFHEDQNGGYWVLTRYADQYRVHKNPGTFSTEWGVTIDTFRGERRDPAAGKMLEFSEPAHHKVLRRELNKPYSRKAMSRLEDQVREYAIERIEDALAKGEFDFADDIADRMTSAVVFSLLGFPEQDWDMLFDLSRRSQEETSPCCPFEGPFRTSAQAANHDLLKYLMRRLDQDPDGHLALLASMRFGGSELSPREVVLNILNIMQGGNSTTRHAASGGMLALIEHPEQAERLREKPALLKGMVEEVVRWTTPAIHFIRKATKDVEMRGQTIREGDSVTVWTISANRDEEIFHEPDTFDAFRSPNRHLGFITGPHICLGMNLARLELRVLFDELLRRAPGLRLAGDVERVPSNFIAGIARMPVAVG